MVRFILGIFFFGTILLALIFGVGMVIRNIVMEIRDGVRREDAIATIGVLLVVAWMYAGIAWALIK